MAIQKRFASENFVKLNEEVYNMPKQKIYADRGYVDDKALPDGAGVYQQLVTDADGNPKWEKRTHYVALTPVAIESQDVTMAKDEELGCYLTVISTPLNQLMVGECIVTWDGVEYTCNVNAYPDEDFYDIGNYSIVDEGLPDSGEPFLIGGGIYGEIQILTNSTEAMHTFSLSGFTESIIALPEKYIPELPYVSTKFNQELTEDQKRAARWNIGAGRSEVGANTFQEITGDTISNKNLGAGNVLIKFVDSNIVGPCEDGDAFIGYASTKQSAANNYVIHCYFTSTNLFFDGEPPKFGVINHVVASSNGRHVRLATANDVAYTPVLITDQTATSIGTVYNALFPIYDIPKLQ